MENTTLELIDSYIESYYTYQAKRLEISEAGGEIVKRLRQEIKMSQRKLAIALGVTPSYLSKVEHGALPFPADLARKLRLMHREATKEQTK